MRRLGPDTVLEIVLPIGVILLALWLLLGSSSSFSAGLSRETTPQPILTPWRSDTEISPGWFLVGIGRRADGQVAIQLRSPEHREPAWVTLAPRPKGSCPAGCSRNLKMNLEFTLTRQSGAGTTGVSGIPESLSKAFQSLCRRIDVNDVYPDAATLLDANWPEIGPRETTAFRLGNMNPAPLPPPLSALAWLILSFGILWFIFRVTRAPSRLHAPLFFLSISALAAWLRLPNLDAPILSDGPLQRLAYAHEPVLDILLMRTPELHHPPLTFLLLRLSAMLGGLDEASLRFPFWLAATALVPLLYLLTRRLVGREAGLLVGLLAALHPAMIDLSSEINDFSLMMLGATLMLLAYARALDAPTSGLRRGLVAAAGILTIHGNMLGIVWVAALVLWDWLVRPARRVVLRPDAVLALLAGALPVIGLLVKALWAKVGAAPPLRLPGLDWGTETPLELLTSSLQVLFLPPYGLVFFVFAGWGAFSLLRGPLTRRKGGLWVWLACGLVAALCGLYRVDRIRAAYTVVLLVPLLPLAAAPLVRLVFLVRDGWPGLGRRLVTAFLGSLLLAAPLLTTVAGGLPAATVDPFDVVRAALEAESYPQTVALVSRMGPLATYHLCGRVELWEDREGAGEHPCRDGRTLMALGMPYDWIADGPTDMDRRLAGLMPERPFLLLLGSYSSPQLSEWASRRCKPLVTERQVALLRCPALVVPK